MSPAGKKYKKEYSFSLWRIAEGDLESAKLLAQSTKGRPENIIYLVQQSVEKCLKAVQCFKTQEILHTHDLTSLIQMLPESEQPPEAHRLGSLTQYATIRRYEEGFEELTKNDLDLTLEVGSKVLEWSKEIIFSNKN